MNRIPQGWVPEEFWWAVEQLEKFGDKYNLFDLAWSLGIKFDPKRRGDIKIIDLLITILTEGGSKEEIIKAVKRFAEKQAEKKI